MASDDGKCGHPRIDLEYRSEVIDRVRAAHASDADIEVVCFMARRWIRQRELERIRNRRHEASKVGRSHRGRRVADGASASAERPA
jgi:hypothetical protein